MTKIEGSQRRVEYVKEKVYFCYSIACDGYFGAYEKYKYSNIENIIKIFLK